MNELVVRITILTLCVIVLLTVIILAITGDNDSSSAEVDLSDYYYVETTETTAAKAGSPAGRVHKRLFAPFDWRG